MKCRALDDGHSCLNSKSSHHRTNVPFRKLKTHFWCNKTQGWNIHLARIVLTYICFTKVYLRIWEWVFVCLFFLTNLQPIQTGIRFQLVPGSPSRAYLLPNNRNYCCKKHNKSKTIHGPNTCHTGQVLSKIITK